MDAMKLLDLAKKLGFTYSMDEDDVIKQINFMENRENNSVICLEKKGMRMLINENVML